MRVPGIAWMPGRIPAGSTCREIASTTDLFTTCVKWSGAKLPDDRAVDGADITALLTGSGTVQRNAFLFYRGTQIFAARLGPWKAHFRTQSGYGMPKPEMHEPPLLFHLGADPGERFNVAADHPEVITAMVSAVERHRATVKPVQSQLTATGAK